MSEVDLAAPSYTDDDYRRLHAQLVDTQRQLEEERRSADGEFVKAAIRVMQANPGFSARDYADSGISADDFETFFAEDMNEAWRCYEREKARAEAAEAKLAALPHMPAGRWQRASAPPKIGGTYVVGGYVDNGTWHRHFETAFASLILTETGPDWTLLGNARIPIEYWLALPSHPEAPPPAPSEKGGR